MLVSLVVIIQPEKRATLPTLTGEAVHGMFFRWLASQDVELVNQLHNIITRKPFTISNIQPLEMRPGQLLPLTPLEVVPDKFYWFRITSCHEFFSKFLVKRLYQQTQLALPPILNCAFTVRKVTLDPNEHTWAGCTSWAELVQQVLTELELVRDAKQRNKLALFFYSPTTFKQSRKPLPLIVPLPQQTFISLFQYWNENGPFPIADDFTTFLAENVYISAYDLKSELASPNGSIKMNCFRGRCEYTIYTDNLDWLQAFHVLARFAFFAGVGYKTSMGFGQTIATL